MVDDAPGYCRLCWVEHGGGGGGGIGMPFVLAYEEGKIYAVVVHRVVAGGGLVVVYVRTRSSE